MYPLTPSELGDDFDLDTAYQWGTIPLVWASDGQGEVLQSYVQLCLKEEIIPPSGLTEADPVISLSPLSAALMRVRKIYTLRVVARPQHWGDSGLLRESRSADGREGICAGRRPA